MDAEFWLKRWQEGATGFHLNRVTPLLTKHWPALGLVAGARVFVPLCGKSLDMVWLAAQGYKVLGVELSSIAVQQFFQEQALEPVEHDSALGRHYVAGQIEIICGDVFQLDKATLATCSGVFDRGALVALPPAMRADYAQHLYANLAHNYRGMVLTLEYDQSAMDGPPFSVPASEIHTLFNTHAHIRLLDSMDILEKEPKFAERGLKALVSSAWGLEGKR